MLNEVIGEVLGKPTFWCVMELMCHEKNGGYELTLQNIDLYANVIRFWIDSSIDSSYFFCGSQLSTRSVKPPSPTTSNRSARV